MAACAALVLATRGGDDFDEELVLTGRTERGDAIELVVRDDRLHSVATTVLVYCPAQRVEESWRWTWSDGGFGAMRHEGSRFRVSELWRFPERRPPMVQLNMLRGTLAEDGKSARGTVEGRWRWGGFVCERTVRFSARDRS